LLATAIQYSNRAYIFDNSGSAYIRLAEIMDGKIIESHPAGFPEWLKTALWDHLDIDH
jgi:predicted ABC-type ATPase